MKNHQYIKDRLHDYTDGYLSDDEQTQIATHLESCSECRSEFEQIGSLLARTGELPQSMDPPANLWKSIERQIQPATVVSSTAPEQSFGAKLRQWIFAGSLVTAGIVAFLVYRVGSKEDAAHQAETPASAQGLSESPDPHQPAPSYVVSLVRALEYQCMGAGKLLLASTQESEHPSIVTAATTFDTDVRQLDLAIAETHAALRENPDDAELLRMLMSGYQRKLSVLHRAIRCIEEV